MNPNQEKTGNYLHDKDDNIYFMPGKVNKSMKQEISYSLHSGDTIYQESLPESFTGVANLSIAFRRLYFWNNSCYSCPFSFCLENVCNSEFCFSSY